MISYQQTRSYSGPILLIFIWRKPAQIFGSPCRKSGQASGRPVFIWFHLAGRFSFGQIDDSYEDEAFWQVPFSFGRQPPDENLPARSLPGFSAAPARIFGSPCPYFSELVASQNGSICLTCFVATSYHTLRSAVLP